MEDKIVIELKKYVKRQCKIKHITEKQVIQDITYKVCYDYLNGNYDFAENLKFRKKVTWGKKRLIATYDDMSVEYFLSVYVAQLLKKQINFDIPKFHSTAETFINNLQKISNIKKFTIIQFDFIDFFNSHSQEYIYKKFLSKFKLDSIEKILLENYFYSVPFSFAGLMPSNTIAEIIYHKIKESLISNLKNYNLI